MADKPLETSGKKLEESAKKIEKSTAKVEVSTARVEDSADRRTVLAADRTVFAAERTYAAWVRTGLFSFASGAGAHTLLKDSMRPWMVIIIGSVLLLFSAFCFAVAVWRNAGPGAPPPNPDVRRIPPGLLVVINGFLALTAFVALAELWFGPL